MQVLNHQYRLIGIHKVWVFNELDSTNNYILDNFRLLSHNDVILAHSQINGRGRYDKKWISNKNSLSFSLYIQKILNNKVENIAQILAISIVNFLREQKIRAFLKWPNDVYIDNYKVAGILVEKINESTTSSEISNLVCGVGINLNNDENFFKCIDQNATSLLIYHKKNYNKFDVLGEILKYYELYMKQFLMSGFEPFVTIWKKYCLLQGKKVRLNSLSNSYNELNQKMGSVLGINCKGKIDVLLEENRKIIELHSDSSLKVVN